MQQSICDDLLSLSRTTTTAALHPNRLQDAGPERSYFQPDGDEEEGCRR